jgi:4-alpha-glucanotransferase
LALGGESLLTGEEHDALASARASQVVEYALVRPMKQRVFRLAFDRFVEQEWKRQGPRADRLKAFVAREAWWLDEYALFRAIHARENGRYWREWDAGVRDRDPQALAEARESLAQEILFFVYLQWVAAEQWERARTAAAVGVFGDFPFMVSGDSADVWSRQEDFRLDASVGAPPDAFSETGQDWGFPAYRWTEIAARGDEWLRGRARRSAELYDGYRVDHLVGFFRTYIRESDGSAAFLPSDETDQLAQGERLLAVFKNTSARVIAEDLGVIPDFVREALARYDVPGYKVLRWEREWDLDAQPFREPLEYAKTSVATSGTHDTETLAEWWDTAPAEERAALCELAPIREAGCTPDEPFSDRVRDAILATLYASNSDIALIPIQDVFGWRDRINTPAVVSEANWTWRLPWPVDELTRVEDAKARARNLRELAGRYKR